MKRTISIAAAVLLALGSATGSSMAQGPVFAAPGAAPLPGGPVFGAPGVSDPVCIAGFATIQQLSWLLRCRKTVTIGQMAATVAQAEGANCTPYRYWNYGPNVTTSVNRANGTAIVEYICGHVEG